MCTIERNCKSEFKQQFSTPVGWDNDIKTDIVAVVNVRRIRVRVIVLYRNKIK